MRNNKKIDERQMLKVLDIPDWRHMSKDKVMQFVSMLPNVDPKVAMKALEQFPEYTKICLSMLSNLSQTISEQTKDNKESMKTFYDSCQSQISSLQNQLNSGELTFEQKQAINEEILGLIILMNEKDTENKKFIIKIIQNALGFTAVLALTLSTIFGSNIKFDVGKFLGNRK